MNICLDVRLLGKLGSRSGIFFVLQNIFNEFRKRNVNLYLYLEEQAHLKDLSMLTKSFPEDHIFYKGRDFSKIDVFLSPSYKIPDFIRQYPHISRYTILHDCIPFLLPRYFGRANSWFGELVNSFREDDFYFVVSRYTKRDFLKYWPQIDEKNMIVAPNAANFSYKPNKDKNLLKKILDKYHIPLNKKFIFSCSSLDPRKNLLRCIKTFLEFIDQNKIDNMVYVIAGKDVMQDAEKWAEQIPNFSKYKDKIIRAGYVDDEDLEVLYSNAEWFVYTSQYEGFGMPPLEAMACGCPVITSNNTSLPEVVGDAGQMIDWDSDEQHVKAYEKYYFDKKYRDEMAQNGLKRSKLFSWEKTVDVILNKMEEVEKRKNQKPLVTIITPTFNLIKQNREKTFIQSITSAHNQMYKNIEHIVIDGGSKDGTLDVLKEYKEKGWITYYSEPDRGLYDAINKGILKAKGKYVVVLNSDDFYCDDRGLEWLVKKAEEQDADACCASAKSIDEKTMDVKSLWSCYQTRSLIFGQHACHQTFLIKTDVMKELGLYDLDYKVSSDTAFMYKMLQAAKRITMIEPFIICYRLGGISSNTAAVKADVITALFQNYGQYHQLTALDAQNLVHYSFLKMPLNKAIQLGAKLEKQEWIAQYFTSLLEHHLNHQTLLTTKKEMNKMKSYLFGLIPLFSYKRKQNKAKIKVLGIPILKIKTNSSHTKIRYYFLGIPVLKKICR